MSVGKALPATGVLHWDPIPLEDIRDAQERTRGVVVRTPLVRLDADTAEPELHLKLELCNRFARSNCVAPPTPC